MPNRFQLIRKTDVQAGPVSPNQIDREICGYLGVECHPPQYAYGWFTAIGIQLACGETFDDIDRMLCESGWATAEVLREINQWLAYHFTPRSWAEVGTSVSHSAGDNPTRALSLTL